MRQIKKKNHTLNGFARRNFLDLHKRMRCPTIYQSNFEDIGMYIKQL